MSRTGILASLLSPHKQVRYGEHPCQRADLHLPKGPGPHPVAVVIHGGSWQATYGKIVMRPVCADLVSRGWAAWNIEYRRLGRGQGGGWPETFNDVAAAVDHLQHVDAPLDHGRLVLVGHSAGGQLALWAAGRSKLEDPTPPLTPSAAVSLAGVNDLSGACRENPHGSVAALMGGAPDEHPDRYRRADPLLQAPLTMPVLLVHGTEDETVSVRRSRDYAAAAAAATGEVELVEIPGSAGRHRALINPSNAGWQAAADWIERR